MLRKFLNLFKSKRNKRRSNKLFNFYMTEFNKPKTYN